jgi:DNA ligase-1
MEERIPPLREQGDEERKEQLRGWWRELSTFEIFILNKVLSGGFRVGVSRKLAVRALARAFNLSEPLLTHRLTGEWSPSAEFFLRLTAAAEDERMPPSRPYPFFLAYPLESGAVSHEGLEEYQVEWKYDGIRAQVIKREGEVYIWSRGEELVTEQFPELREAASRLPEGTVVDGEIVAWNGEEPMPFNYLQRRLGRKKVGAREMEETPVHLIVYDCLEAGGEDIRSLPLSERRTRLETVVEAAGAPSVSLSPTVEVSSLQDLEERRQWAREHGVEGLMLKRRDAPYQEGRKKGPWWKYKVDPFRLDAVLMYAQAGSGKRANLFTDYTFGLWREGELVPFAKAYSGLTNEEIRELDRWIRRNTVEKYGPARGVRREQVFEIAFEGIARSKRHKSGVAVRFPRIDRWRKEKPPEEADTLERAYELIP